MIGKFLKKRSQKTGLPPGTLVHIGRVRENKAGISLFDYDESQLQETRPETIEDCLPYRDHETVTWIDIEGLDQEMLKPLGECYGIHPLIQEDILNTDQRPKFDDLDDYIYLVFRMFDYQEPEGEIQTEQVSLILGENYVISFQEGFQGDVFDPIRDRLRTGRGKLRKSGPDYLAYTLLDSVVDQYFLIMEKIGERMELLEDELIEDPAPETLRSIHHLKREVLMLRKSIWPLRGVVIALERSDSPLIKEETRLFLRDVYDHTVQIVDTIETYREMLSGMLDIYLSSMSNHTNEVMKVLTVIATIFIPLTFIAGVYGMNFHFMPELSWSWGYPVIWLVMIAVTITMIIFFKRKNWW